VVVVKCSEVCGFAAILSSVTGLVYIFNLPGFFGDVFELTLPWGCLILTIGLLLLSLVVSNIPETWKKTLSRIDLAGAAVLQLPLAVVWTGGGFSGGWPWLTLHIVLFAVALFGLYKLAAENSSPTVNNA